MWCHALTLFSLTLHNTQSPNFTHNYPITKFVIKYFHKLHTHIKISCFHRFSCINTFHSGILAKNNIMSIKVGKEKRL